MLGKHENGKLLYRGHVTMGVSREDFQKIAALPRSEEPGFAELPRGNEAAVWVEPVLVGTVKYMEKTKSGGMRQPVFKGLRLDKAAEEI